MSTFAAFAKYASTVVLALVTVQCLIQGVSSAALPTLEMRLLNPCGGGEVVVGSQSAPEVEYVAHDLYHEMSAKALETKNKVRTLMDLYTKDRFESQTFEADSQHLVVDQLPILPQATGQYLSNMQALEETHKTYKFLAVATMFLKQAKMEEDLHEGGAYNHHFNDIKETGMFWMACQLHKIVTMHGANLQTETINDALEMEISDVENDHLRRTRDFVILRDLESMLERSTVVFTHLKDNASQDS